MILPRKTPILQIGIGISSRQMGPNTPIVPPSRKQNVPHEVQAQRILVEFLVELSGDCNTLLLPYHGPERSQTRPNTLSTHRALIDVHVGDILILYTTRIRKTRV